MSAHYYCHIIIIIIIICNFDIKFKGVLVHTLSSFLFVILVSFEVILPSLNMQCKVFYLSFL